MFATDFAVLVAVAIVETCLAHAALHCAHSGSIPAGAKWQLTRARSMRGVIRPMGGERLSRRFAALGLTKVNHLNYSPFGQGPAAPQGPLIALDLISELEAMCDRRDFVAIPRRGLHPVRLTPA